MKKTNDRTKEIAAAVLAASMVLLVTGCGMTRGTMASSVAESVENEEGPDQKTQKNITLDFDEAQASCEEALEDYELGSYIDTYVDEEKKVVNLIWPLHKEATEADGVEYADAFVRAFNDACYEQDFSIALSGKDSYGGLYQTYAVNVQVFREEDILKPENYLVSMTIPAGSHEKIVPFSQYDGMNEVMLSDGPAMIPGGKYKGDEKSSAKAQAETKEETLENGENK